MTQKESCIVCQIIDGRLPSKKIYEDDSIVAVLDVNGSNPGHCFIFPKNHYPIIEQVPERELSSMFLLANRISVVLFESMNYQGTNIFVANGVPAGQTVAHFMINVIPRKQNDGVNLQWPPKQFDEEEMSTVELKIKEQVEKIGLQKSEAPASVVKKEFHTTSIPKVSGKDSSSFMRQITRMP